MDIVAIGDTAISVSLGNTIDPAVNAKLRQLLQVVAEARVPGIIDMVPTYTSLLIVYDPFIVSYDELCHTITARGESLVTQDEARQVRIVELPTVYGGAYGEDIEFVASHAGLTVEEVISIHTSRDYLVYMLGFLPGFAYLGGMDERIATPRLKTPRAYIAKGSVGIAGSQTGTYPSDSPGGWQIIGRTPVCLYDMNNTSGALLQAGDYVRYVPISADEYEAICREGQAYAVTIHEVSEKEVRLG